MNASTDLPGWSVLDGPDEVAQRCASLVLEAANRAIAARGEYRLVLAGGRTPLSAYRLLAQAEADWPRWKIYYGDERCVAADDSGRNSLAARQAWLDQIALPAENHFLMPAEKGAETGALEYAVHVHAALPFDTVLLGVGEDGHVASLFPGRESAPGLVTPVHDSPKPPPDRVSLTYAALNQARQVIIMATGDGKRDAVSRWRSGEALPVNRILPNGTLHVLLDRAAAGTGP